MTLKSPAASDCSSPLLRVIFVRPDSPWLWQQSGLWEPDANQAAQMSGAESQGNASWGCHHRGPQVLHTENPVGRAIVLEHGAQETGSWALPLPSALAPV